MEPSGRPSMLEGDGQRVGHRAPLRRRHRGNLQYYVQGFNANNDPVATGGDRNNPFRTAVKRTFNGEVPLLPPGRTRRASAPTPATVPPTSLALQEAGRSLRAPGDSSAQERRGRLRRGQRGCKSGTCTKEKTCAAGRRTPPRSTKKFWVGIAGAYDFVSIPSGSGRLSSSRPLRAPVSPSERSTTAPSAAARTSRLRCLERRGRDARHSKPGQSDKVAGGFAPGNAFGSTPRSTTAPNANMMIGARVGYVCQLVQWASGEHRRKDVHPAHVGAARYLRPRQGRPRQEGVRAVRVFVAGGVSTKYSAEVHGVSVISRPPASA